METREINVLVLAYLGDTIYENYVRKSKLKGFHGNIVPVGGGKDSIVTLELSKHEKEKQFSSFSASAS